MTMKLTFLYLVFFFLNIDRSHESNQVEDFKKQLQSFYEDCKETEKKLQEWRDGATPVCVASKVIQIKEKQSHGKSIQTGVYLTQNTEFLEALSSFTNKRLILTPRIHRKLLQDKHDARQLIENHKHIYGSVQHYAKYTLKEQDCTVSGSEELPKLMIQVYKNFQVLVKLMQ